MGVGVYIAGECGPHLLYVREAMNMTQVGGDDIAVTRKYLKSTRTMTRCLNVEARQ